MPRQGISILRRAVAAARTTGASNMAGLRQGPTNALPTPIASLEVQSRFTVPVIKATTAAAPVTHLSYKPSPILSSLLAHRPNMGALIPPSLLPGSSSTTTTTVRYATYGQEYQPSQRKRKRKHGFLARLRKHRTVLKARKKQGRRFLSH